MMKHIKKLFRSLQIDRYLGQPLEIEGGRPPQLLSLTLYTVSLSCIVFIFWASVVEIPEIARTKGELVPEGQVKPVEHLEGGIIKEILIQNGTHVTKNQPLLKLQPKLVKSDLNRLKSRLNWLKLEDIRLSAEISGTTPNFGSASTDHKLLVRQQVETFHANINAHKKTIAAFETTIAHEKLEISALENEIKKLEDERDTYFETFSMQNNLVHRKHTSRRNFLESKAEYQEAKTAVASAKVRLTRARKVLAKAISDKDEKIAETQKLKVEQRAKVTEEIIELEHQIAKFRDQFDRLIIRSPIAGVAKDLTKKGYGSVVKPGERLAEIVPQEDTLLAEVKIKPRDIGHVKVGDPAELTITTYDFNVYGKFMGTVKKISASSFKDEDGSSYFRGEISLGTHKKSGSSTDLKLIPGMLVEANIVTGSKSIVRYVLSPIYKSVNVAFAER